MKSLGINPRLFVSVRTLNVLAIKAISVKCVLSLLIIPHLKN